VSALLRAGLGALGLLVALVFARGLDLARAEPVYAPEQRVAYLAAALEALASIDASTLRDTERYIYLVERNQCQAPIAALRLGCLLEAAGRSCRQRAAAQRAACDAISDILITNRLSEGEFVSRKTRYDLMSKASDYREAMVRALRRRYATLALELGLSDPETRRADQPEKLAAAIDKYCLEVASTRSMAWQHCAAALVWFIGTSTRAASEAQ
jgi:hypothetical protein